MLGYEDWELENELDTWLKLLCPEDRDWVTTALQDHLDGKTPVYATEHRLLHKDGHWVWVLDIGRVVEWDEHGKPFRASGVHQEISERKELESKLKAMSARAGAANEAKTRFLANMSHEIRTPLNVIIGACELLQTTALDPAQEELREMMLTAGESLLGIVDDILDLTKIEAGKVRVERVPMYIAEFVRGTALLLQKDADKKGLTLNLLLPEEPLQVLTDPLKLRQILLNLLSNAVKFTEEGEITLRLTYQSAGSQEVRVTLEVSDTGIGMSETQLARVQERFEQADSSITRRYGGTGLGITISNHLANLLGGRISIQSALGVGSKFTFEATLPEVESEDTDPSEEDASRNYGVTVILAEDNELNRKIAVRTLEKLGIKCLLARDGSEVLDLSEKEHELIFMDCHMPLLDGLEATRRLRKSGYTKRIVAFTANVMTDDIASYREAGMDEFLSKPLRRKALIEILDRCLLS